MRDSRSTDPSIIRRWLRFNFVGLIGIGVQLAVLTLCKSVLGIPYLWTTAIAVEGAVLHNFVWHERYTWRDRVGSAGGSWRRLLRFNFTTGAVSIAGNLLLMRLLVGTGGLNFFAANLIAIAACSIANFLVSHWFVFVPGLAPAPDNGRIRRAS